MFPRSATAQEAVEYYGLDAVGSVRVVFDNNGNVSARTDYGPFGHALTTVTGLPSRAYAGLFRDGEAGLDHADARSYQARTGRFSSVDPVYADLFNPQGLNRYAYAYNAPTKYVDPQGLTAWNGLCNYSSAFEDGVYRTYTECLSGDMQAFIGGYGWSGTSFWDPYFGGSEGGRGGGSGGAGGNS